MGEVGAGCARHREEASLATESPTEHAGTGHHDVR